MSTALNPVQQYLLRLVLFGAGKTIQHKNSICEVVETTNVADCFQSSART